MLWDKFCNQFASAMNLNEDEDENRIRFFYQHGNENLRQALNLYQYWLQFANETGKSGENDESIFLYYYNQSGKDVSVAIKNYKAALANSFTDSSASTASDSTHHEDPWCLVKRKKPTPRSPTQNKITTHQATSKQHTTTSSPRRRVSKKKTPPSPYTRRCAPAASSNDTGNRTSGDSIPSPPRSKSRHDQLPAEVDRTTLEQSHPNSVVTGSDQASNIDGQVDMSFEKVVREDLKHDSMEDTTEDSTDGDPAQWVTEINNENESVKGSMENSSSTETEDDESLQDKKPAAHMPPNIPTVRAHDEEVNGEVSLCDDDDYKSANNKESIGLGIIKKDALDEFGKPTGFAKRINPDPRADNVPAPEMRLLQKCVKVTDAKGHVRLEWPKKDDLSDDQIRAFLVANVKCACCHAVVNSFDVGIKRGQNITPLETVCYGLCRTMKKEWGMEKVVWEELLHVQDNKCSLCGLKFLSGDGDEETHQHHISKAVLDHHHGAESDQRYGKSKKDRCRNSIRGLAHHGCNVAVGHLEKVHGHDASKVAAALKHMAKFLPEMEGKFKQGPQAMPYHSAQELVATRQTS